MSRGGDNREQRAHIRQVARDGKRAGEAGVSTGAGQQIGHGDQAIGQAHPVALSTAAYSLATVTTRNPALVLASGVMGTLFAAQRRASGGIQAPVLAHLTWSTLMLRYLPPLFRDTKVASS
jgi:hypothetical protein